MRVAGARRNSVFHSYSHPPHSFLCSFPPLLSPPPAEVANLPTVDDCLCLSQSAIDTLYSIGTAFLTLSPALRSLFLDTLQDLSGKVLSLAASHKALSQQAKNNTKAVLYFLAAVTARVETGMQAQAQPAATKSKAASQDDEGGNDDNDDDDGDFGAPAKKGAKKAPKAAKASKAKAGGGKGAFNWPEYRASLLELISEAAEMEPSSLWSMGIVQENFSAAMWGYALSLLEARPAGMSGHTSVETKARAACVAIVVRCVACFSQSGASCSFTQLTTALLDAMLRADHMSTAAADVCSKASVALAAEVLGEVARMNMDGLPASGVKNIGSFVEALAKSNPQLMTQLLPTVMKQLDSGAHQIRSSLLHAMGAVIIHIHAVCVAAPTGAEEPKEDKEAKEVKETKADKDDDDDEEEKDASPDGEGEGDKSDKDFRKNPALLPRVRNSLLDMLVERTHDKSPYSRAAVLRVWQVLLEAGAVPARRVGSIAEIAVDRLLDKVCAPLCAPRWPQ